MTTLTEFLLARIAEDEAAVEGIRQGEDPDFFWGPGRIRAECEAKRQIVWIHSGPQYGRPDAHLCHDSMTADDRCDTLHALALPYADHDDYREEWKP